MQLIANQLIVLEPWLLQINNFIYVIMYTVATTISTICGNYFTQHIPLHIPRRSLNKPKPIPDYLPD